jgi:hypothetical protein
MKVFVEEMLVFEVHGAKVGRREGFGKWEEASGWMVSG